MTGFVQGIKTLFTGADTGAQEKAARDARDQQTIALTRQKETEKNAAALTEQTAGEVSRQPRGRRLLQAATGDAGVQTTLG